MTKPIRIATTHDDFLPVYTSCGSAGADIFAAISTAIILEPSATKVIACGIFLELPPLYEAQVRPRSGLAAKHGITVLNSPGTIDSDYRGEVCVILHNTSHKPFSIEPKMRIAQLVIAPVVQADFKPITREELSKTSRDEKGFDSSGSF